MTLSRFCSTAQAKCAYAEFCCGPVSKVQGDENTPNEEEIETMTKQELPNEIFIPSIELPGRGAIDAQFRDENGDVNIPVFRDLPRAIDWLRNGGLELWKRQDSAMRTKLEMGGEPVVRQKETSEYLMLLALFGSSPKKYLNFEPEAGSLFAPPDRRVAA
jgi:hypothetical protein